MCFMKFGTSAEGQERIRGYKRLFSASLFCLARSENLQGFLVFLKPI